MASGAEFELTGNGQMFTLFRRIPFTLNLCSACRRTERKGILELCQSKMNKDDIYEMITVT